jgi:hypothetical protein
MRRPRPHSFPLPRARAAPCVDAPRPPPWPHAGPRRPAAFGGGTLRAPEPGCAACERARLCLPDRAPCPAPCCPLDAPSPSMSVPLGHAAPCCPGRDPHIARPLYACSYILPPARPAASRDSSCMHLVGRAAPARRRPGSYLLSTNQPNTPPPRPRALRALAPARAPVPPLHANHLPFVTRVPALPDPACPACLPACLPARLPACLPARLPACLPAFPPRCCLSAGS